MDTFFAILHTYLRKKLIWCTVYPSIHPSSRNILHHKDSNLTFLLQVTPEYSPARVFQTGWSLDLGWGGVVTCLAAALLWLLLARIMRYNPISLSWCYPHPRPWARPCRRVLLTCIWVCYCGHPAPDWSSNVVNTVIWWWHHQQMVMSVMKGDL